MASTFRKNAALGVFALSLFANSVFATSLYSGPSSSIEINDIDSPLGNLLRDAGLTEPQRQMGAVVEDICPPPLGFIGNSTPERADLQARCTEMVVNVLSGNPALIKEAQAGLQGVASEESLGVASLEVDGGAGQMNNIGERISNVRGAATTGLVRGGESGFHWSGGAAGDGDNKWGFFVSGLYASSDRDSTDRESGFEADDYGFTVGLDYTPNEKMLLGAAFGYKSSDADIDANGGSLESDSFSGFFYFSFYPNENWYVDLMFGHTDNNHDQDRRLAWTIAGLTPGSTTVVNQTAISETDSDEFSFSISAGRNFLIGNWFLTPYARLDYANIKIDGYTERMSAPNAPGNGLALQIDNQEFDSLMTTFGARLSSQFQTSFGDVVPDITFEYVHEFENESDPLTGRFVNESLGRTFTLLRDDPDENFFNIGAGLNAMFTDTATGFVRYQALVGYEDLSVHTVEFGVRITF